MDVSRHLTDAPFSDGYILKSLTSGTVLKIIKFHYLYLRSHKKGEGKKSEKRKNGDEGGTPSPSFFTY